MAGQQELPVQQKREVDKAQEPTTPMRAFLPTTDIFETRGHPHRGPGDAGSGRTFRISSRVDHEPREMRRKSGLNGSLALGLSPVPIQHAKRRSQQSSVL